VPAKLAEHRLQSTAHVRISIKEIGGLHNAYSIFLRAFFQTGRYQGIGITESGFNESFQSLLHQQPVPVPGDPKGLATQMPIYLISGLTAENGHRQQLLDRALRSSQVGHNPGIGDQGPASTEFRSLEPMGERPSARGFLCSTRSRRHSHIMISASILSHA